ncbi:MAG: hypothetical protein LBQ12_14235 [Deltaproteobacteria bacterium]|jgi:hypothetical protein|nr:hypothetical protein [Deltaproteobacteria bacterium]
MGTPVTVDNEVKVKGSTKLTNEWATVDPKWAQVGVRFCHWAASEVTGKGKTLFETVLSYMAYAFIILNTVQAIRIADLRYQIAKGYGDLAQNRWDRFAARFKPLEAYVINLLMNDPAVFADYDRIRAIYLECARDLGGTDRWRRQARTYALCIDPTLVQARSVAQSLHEDDLVNLGYRSEEDVTKLRDIDRWNRRLVILNLGRDLTSISAQAARAGDAILEQGQISAVQGVGQAIGFLTYLRDAREVSYSNLGMVYSAASAPSLPGS